MKEKEAQDVKNVEEEKKYWCKLVSKNAQTKTLLISQDSYTIGRASENNFQIKDAQISGNHMILTRSINKSTNEYEYTVEDKSTNGTFLNGKKLGKNVKEIIKNGDEIVLVAPPDPDSIKIKIN